MKPSTLPPVLDFGTNTAISFPIAIGMSTESLMGVGVSGCAGLLSSSGFHSVHWAISFAKSVTSSENMVHVGGFGDPPYVDRRDMKAVSPFTDTV